MKLFKITHRRIKIVKPRPSLSMEKVIDTFFAAIIILFSDKNKVFFILNKFYFDNS